MSQRTHCPAGHEYTEANTKILRRPKKDGTPGEHRQCIACKKAWRPKAKHPREQRERTSEQVSP